MKWIARSMMKAPVLRWMMSAAASARTGVLVSIAGGIVLLTVMEPIADARIFKWVDADGKVQYSEKPPPDGQFTEITPGQPPSSSADEATRQLQDLLRRQKESENRDEVDKAQKKEEAAKQAKLEQDCIAARNNLTLMENKTGSHLTVMEEGGAVHRLSEDERQAKMTETRKFINDNCQ